MRRKKDVSLLDDDFAYVEDDGDTGAAMDPCEDCGCPREQHDDDGACRCGRCDVYNGGLRARPAGRGLK